MRRLLALAVGVGLCTLALPAADALPTRPHVFVIVLENKTYETTFGADSPTPFLGRALPRQGALLRSYHGVAHLSLPNYIAMVSGQAPNPHTQSDCQVFTDFIGTVRSDGQAVGHGCVYPAKVKTVADQLDAAGLSWKGYMEDMGAPCRHPKVGSRDDTQSAGPTDQYAVRHNPFVYFHSVIDDRARCESHVVGLRHLADDLRTVSTTSHLSFITPDLCADGHDEHCADGGAGGYEGIDGFLRRWVPRITSSPAFKRDGVLVVTFDEAEAADERSDARACCHQPTGPNTPRPGITGPGGGRTGALVISPFTRPGTVSDEPYNHYSLLRSIEDLFGLGHLGFAAQAGLRPFGVDVLNLPR